MSNLTALDHSPLCNFISLEGLALLVTEILNTSISSSSEVEESAVAGHAYLCYEKPCSELVSPLQ